jgi:hypothetical protein
MSVAASRLAREATASSCRADAVLDSIDDILASRPSSSGIRESLAESSLALSRIVPRKAAPASRAAPLS